MTKFSLWLEFEIYEGGYPGPEDNPYCDFCNAMVTIDGVRYAATIWTFAYLEFMRTHDNVGEELDRPRTWLLPPDLIVEKLERALITRSIAEMLREGGLPEAWRVPDSQEDDEGSGPVLH